MVSIEKLYPDVNVEEFSKEVINFIYDRMDKGLGDILQDIKEEYGDDKDKYDLALIAFGYLLGLNAAREQFIAFALMLGKGEGGVMNVAEN